MGKAQDLLQGTLYLTRGGDRVDHAACIRHHQYSLHGDLSRLGVHGQLDELGAEVEVAIGEEQEKHIFNKPTVLVAPKGLPHCPIVTRSIEKPYVCMAVSLTGKRSD